jgi:hypothetical protein
MFENIQHETVMPMHPLVEEVVYTPPIAFENNLVMHKPGVYTKPNFIKPEPAHNVKARSTGPEGYIAHVGSQMPYLSQNFR